MKKASLFLALLIFIFMFAACGSNSSYDYATETAAMPEEAITYDAESSEMLMDNATDGFASDDSAAGNTSITPTDTNRKIIYTSWMQLQAKDYYETANAVIAAVENAGGYISSKYIYDQPYEDSVPYGSYECRIPVDNYSQFISEVDGAGYVLSLEENSEDVTLQYVDIEARLTSLRTQEESLFVMLEQAADVETLITVQNSLMEVQYQIESFTSQLRTLEDLVSYSTVTVDIEEVYEYTPPTPETFTSRIQSAFTESWEDFGYAAQDFAVGFVYVLPGLLVLAVVVLIIVLIIRKASKNAKKKAAQRPRYPHAVPTYSNANNNSPVNAPTYDMNILPPQENTIETQETEEK